jgi:hypothetical protein
VPTTIELLDGTCRDSEAILRYLRNDLFKPAVAAVPVRDRFGTP